MRALAWLLACAWPLAAMRDFGVDLEGDVFAAVAPNEESLRKDKKNSASDGASTSAEGTATSAASAPEAVPPSRDQPGSFFSAPRRTVTLEPGNEGLSLAGTRIKAVSSGSVAEQKGLRRGDRIVAVNGNPFKAGYFARLRSGKVPYTLTVYRTTTTIVKTTVCIKVPAAVVGCYLLLAMVPYYQSHQRMGSAWQDNPLAKFLTHPAVMVSQGSYACRCFINLLMNRTMFDAMGFVALVLFHFGLLYCLVSTLANPLLGSRLPETATARCRYENKGAWLVVTVTVLLRVSRAVNYYGNRSRGFQDFELWAYTIHQLAWVMTYMMVLEIVATNSRILGAVDHRIQQIKNALPCKADDFSEQVHAPCAELVNDTGPQLASLGVPCLCFTMLMLWNSIQIYLCLKVGFVDQNARTVAWFLHIASCVFETGGLAFTVAMGPLRVSSALDGLLDRLAEVRGTAPALHVQLQAAETLLERANGGSRWGIKVWPGIVLNKESLQSVFVRAALSMAAGVAYLDSELGFEKSRENDAAIMADMSAFEANMSSFHHMLTSIKAYIRSNRSEKMAI